MKEAELGHGADPGTSTKAAINRTRYIIQHAHKLNVAIINTANNCAAKVKRLTCIITHSWGWRKPLGGFKTSTGHQGAGTESQKFGRVEYKTICPLKLGLRQRKPLQRCFICGSGPSSRLPPKSNHLVCGPPPIPPKIFIKIRSQLF